MTSYFALALILGAQDPRVRTQAIEASLLRTLETTFWDTKHNHWREMAGKDDPVFLWGYSVLFSTFAIGTKADPVRYKARLERTFTDLEKYWTKKAPGAYAVSPGQGANPDRYYDDNAWIGLAAMEAYEATKEPKYLNLAKKVIRYLRTGEDKKLDGGIYWHENEKNSKNACVNAPAAILAFKLYLATNEKSYIEDGHRWLIWTTTLRDPSDSLIMDNISVSGKVDRTKWSYNSACYYQANNLGLEAVRKQIPSVSLETSVLDAIQSAILEESQNKWIDAKRMLVKNPGMFGMHLLDVLVEKDPKMVQQIVFSVFDKCRNDQGLLGEYWDRKPLASEKLKLMYTASLLRSALQCRLKDKL